MAIPAVHEARSHARRSRERAIAPVPWLRTERVALRALMCSDVGDFVRLNADARVMRYVGPGRSMTREETHAQFRRALRYPSLYAGLGIWHASLVADGSFVGWFALKYCGESTDIEVGYRLAHAQWGKGLATEGARALVRHGFHALGIERIIGVTHPDNVASQNVLRKAGLADEGYGHYYARELRLFAASREAA